MAKYIRPTKEHEKLREKLGFQYRVYLRPALVDADLPTNPGQLTNEHRQAHVTGTREASLINLMERMFYLRDNALGLADTAIAMFRIGETMAFLGLGDAAKKKKLEGMKGVPQSVETRRAKNQGARDHANKFIDDYVSQTQREDLPKRTIGKAIDELGEQWDEEEYGAMPDDSTVRKWYRELTREQREGQEDLAAGDDWTALENLARKRLHKKIKRAKKKIRR